MLGSHFVLRQIPLLLIILGFCLLMVSIRYRVESLNKDKDRLQKEVSYLRTEGADAETVPGVDTHFTHRPRTGHHRCGTCGGTAV